MSEKPPFDPSQPFSVADKPAFDPSKPFEAAPHVGAAEDAVKSLGSGLARATVDTIGGLGDLRDLASRGVDAAGAKFGFDPSTVKTAASLVGGMTPLGAMVRNAPTSQQVMSTVTDPIVSPDYQPQTGLGGVLKTGAQFLPAMADPELGAAGALKTAAKLFATRVAAPALASEAAGKLAEGTAYEPYAKLAGALGGASGAEAAMSKLGAMSAARGAASSLKNVDELKADARSLYQHPDVQAVQIKPQALEGLAATIEQDLQHGQNSGFRPANEPKVFSAIDELRGPARARSSINWDRGTVANGLPPSPDRVVIDVPVKAMETVFKSSNPNFYVPTPAFNVERYAASGAPMSLPEVSASNGRIGFVNGRNRFALAKKNGDASLPISVPSDNVGELMAALKQHGAGPARSSGAATVADLDNVRQVLGNAAKERDMTGTPTRQAVAAGRAIDHIDKFLPNLQQPDLLAGDAAKANAILDTARQTWGAAKRAEQVQTLAANAEINAASSHSGANIQNATKQAFKPLIKNNYAKAAGYNDAEKAALNGIVRGTVVGHLARAAGNVLGGGGGLGMLAGAGAGYEAGGVPGALAGAVAGKAFKAIGNRSTFNAVQKLDRLIRSRAPEALKIVAQNPQIAGVLPSNSIKMLRTMILAEPSLREENQQRQSIGYANP